MKKLFLLFSLIGQAFANTPAELEVIKTFNTYLKFKDTRSSARLVPKLIGSQWICKRYFRSRFDNYELSLSSDEINFTFEKIFTVPDGRDDILKVAFGSINGAYWMRPEFGCDGSAASMQFGTKDIRSGAVNYSYLGAFAQTSQFNCSIITFRIANDEKRMIGIHSVDSTVIGDLAQSINDVNEISGTYDCMRK